MNSKQNAGSLKGGQSKEQSQDFDFNIHFDDETPTEPLSNFEDDEAFQLSEDSENEDSNESYEESDSEERDDINEESDNSDHHFDDNEFRQTVKPIEEHHDIATAEHFNFDEEEHYDFENEYTDLNEEHSNNQNNNSDDFEDDFHDDGAFEEDSEDDFEDDLDESLNKELDDDSFDEYPSEHVVPQMKEIDINANGAEETNAIDKSEDKSLEEELREFQNMPSIKMQSTSNFNGSKQKKAIEEEHYDFEDDATQSNSNSNSNDDDLDDFDFEDHDDSEHDSHESDDGEFPEDRDDEDFEDDLDVKPTSKEIAKMMHKQERAINKEPKISKLKKKNNRTISNYFEAHKMKIILIMILLLISSLWAYASQVGFTTKTIPTFKDNIIKVLKTQGVQMQYTIRERLILHKAKIDIQLNDSTKMQITGTSSITSKMFSNINHNLSDATFEVIDAKINVTGTEDINIPQAIAELSNEIFSKMLEKVSIANSELTVTNAQGEVTNNIFIKNLVFENSATKVSITGLILINSQPVQVSYSYIPSTKKIAVNVKSSVINISLNGTKQTFGTSSKDSQIKGDAEVIVKNLKDFANIFGVNKKLTQNLTNLPQLTLQFEFDYSSLNHDLKLTHGKINALNSLGTFSLNATPDLYQGSIDFDVISITEILAALQENPSHDSKNPTFKKEVKKENVESNANKNYLLNIFSIVTPSKPIEITMKSKNLSSKNESFFQNLETVFTVSKDLMVLQNLKVNAGDATTIEINGEVSKAISFANISIAGQGNYKGIVGKITNILTGLDLKKELTTETSKISFAILQKKPSLIIDDISIIIQDTLNIEGSMQFTEHFTEGSPNSFFQSIKISDTNLNNFNIEPISFPQGVTIFQNMINENERTTSKFVTILNSKFKDITIKDATLTKETQKDIVSFNVDINAEEFQLSNSTSINIQSTIPTIQSETIVRNVQDLQKFYKTIQSIFEKNTIVTPSFEKLDGNASFTLEKSNIFGKYFESVQLGGNIKQGILELVESKFESKPSTGEKATDGEKPLSMKVSGSVDLRRRLPSFDLQIAATNIPMLEFKTLLPFETNFDGNVYGGGSFAFTGTSYNEMLNTLKTTSKFVIQNATFTKLNLDFLGKHLVASHKNVSELDSSYIKEMFEKNSTTKANFIFSMNGGDKKFTIEDCTIKTAYSGGVCYGSVTVPEDGKALIEVIAKFAVPALDINKSLKDVMKLYISSKIKQDSATCEITNDFSQINQYTSYRKATFAM